MIRKIKVTIKGTSPLLMHKFLMEPIEALEKRSPAEQAEIAAYRNPDSGNLYIPGVAIQRGLIQASAYSKGKGRASLVKTAAACFLVSPEYVDLGTKTFEIDARPVVIKATQGRVMRFRPRLNDWLATFTLEYDDTLLTENQVRRIVDDMGVRCGLLDFRPERKGPMGRCVVVKWNAGE